MSHETQEMTDFLNGASVDTMHTGAAFRSYHRLSADACAKEALKIHGKEFKDELKKATAELKKEYTVAIGELESRMKDMKAMIGDMAAQISKKSSKSGN